jgi:Protein of unknown function (DUF3618)
MDQDQSEAGQELDGDQERTPEQVREEIEQTRAELGDTVAALAQKTDVKAQAKHAVGDAKETVSGKISDIRETATAKKDDFVASAQEATPESASEAGQRASTFAKQNRVALIALGAFGLGLVIGKARAR